MIYVIGIIILKIQLLYIFSFQFNLFSFDRYLYLRKSILKKRRKRELTSYDTLGFCQLLLCLCQKKNLKVINYIPNKWKKSFSLLINIIHMQKHNFYEQYILILKLSSSSYTHINFWGKRVDLDTKGGRIPCVVSRFEF